MYKTPEQKYTIIVIIIQPSKIHPVHYQNKLTLFSQTINQSN